MTRMTKTSSLERSDHWVVPLSGELVHQCSYDYAFTLEVGEIEQPYIIRIEQEFVLYNPEGAMDLIDPQADPRQMGATLRLLRKTITRAIAHKDGRLEIDFDDGSLVRVPSSSGYEPWELHGPDDLIMVASAGGDLVVWT